MDWHSLASVSLLAQATLPMGSRPHGTNIVPDPGYRLSFVFVVTKRMRGPTLRGEDGAHLQKKSTTPSLKVFLLNSKVGNIKI